MLILPIINNKKLVSYEVTLKDEQIIEHMDIDPFSNFAKLNEMEVYSNGKCYSKWFDDKNFSNVVILDSIKKASLANYNDSIDIYVCTKNKLSTPTFDVHKINYNLTDNSKEIKELYVRVIDDIRRSIPDNKKGRNISLKDIGLVNNITDQDIDTIKMIKDYVVDEKVIPRYYEHNNVNNIIKLVDGIKKFKFEMIKESEVEIDAYLNTMNSEIAAKTDLGKKMLKKYNIALENTEILSKISKIVIYTSKSKKKVKNNERI